MALREVVSEHDGTTLEFASDGCLDGFDDEEVDFMTRFSLTANRPLNWNVLTVDSHAPERYQNQLAAMDRCREAGARVVALTMPIIVPMNMSFLNFCGLNLMPDWGDILGLPVPERMERLRDPETRRFMVERAASPDAGVFARLTGWDGYVIGDTFSDANEGLTGRRVGDIAAERGDEQPFRHARRHRPCRRSANRPVARRHRQRPGVVGTAPPGLGPPFGDARRFRRRGPPRPHAGVGISDPLPRRLHPRPQARADRNVRYT